MQVQTDYEAEVHVAVFRAEQQAVAAESLLNDKGIETWRVPLAPGRYDVEDPRLRRNARVAIIGAILGAMVGAVVGAGLAVWFFGATFQITVWLAVACAGGGAVIGSLYGIERTARYDDDVARWITIAPGEQAWAVRTHTPLAAAGHGQTRQLLRKAGAVAFLDVPMFESARQGTAGEAAPNTGAPTSNRPA